MCFILSLLRVAITWYGKLTPAYLSSQVFGTTCTYIVENFFDHCISEGLSVGVVAMVTKAQSLVTMDTTTISTSKVVKAFPYLLLSKSLFEPMCVQSWLHATERVVCKD